MRRRAITLAVAATVELGLAAWALAALPPRSPHPSRPPLAHSAGAALSHPGATGVPPTTPPATTPPPAAAPSTATTIPAPAPAPALPQPPPPLVTTTTAAPRASTTTTVATGSAAAASVVPSAPVVTCGTDLPLAQSPDTAYNFLCRAGEVPLTWASDGITVYVAGLSPAQAAVWPAALAQWEIAGHFEVTPTTDEATAMVSVTGVDLAATQPGYTEDGYTTVTWACSPRCHYTEAAVELATNAKLGAAAWTSTILHELGHAAGLNHVSRLGEVMYPVLTASPPVAYASGDAAGLAVLTAERDGTG